MKNLELLQLLHKPIDDILLEAPICAQTGDITYFINSNILHQHDFPTNKTTVLCPQEFNATDLKFLALENKICIVSEAEIHIFDPEGANDMKTVSFDHDIAAIKWNPTEEIIAVVSKNGIVATYIIDYENGIVHLQGRSTVGAQTPDTVYVGWGSKETQFRGSEGKLKNQKPVEVKSIPEGPPAISWRGNGEMFVVNYWVDGKRAFVVFETPCRALFRSEECPGLQAPVAWRPTGNMIATLAEVKDKKSVVIFEKNGQKRFSFDLDFGDVQVKELKWSPCASILTILTEDPSTGCQNIHLLTSSNYKWYEKQVLRFTPTNPLLAFDWLDSSQFTFTLKVVTRKNIIKYVFRSIVNNSSGICAVIDGKNCQITNFNESVIPPTMCLRTLTTPESINFVIVDNRKLTIIDSRQNLKIFDMSQLDVCLHSVDLAASVTDLPDFPLACHHFVSQETEINFCAESASETIIYSLYPATCDVNFIDATDSVKHLFILPGTETYITDLKRITPTLYTSDSCHDVVYQSVKVTSGDFHTCQLTSNCHFYVDDRKVSDCVDSFIVFDAYLLYTTKQNELYCTRIDEKSTENYRRSIEQGATIVAAIIDSPKIVLQLPRGNLETISCRLISIDILDRLLGEGDWGKAIRFIRLEKLNANLLFDLDARRFLGEIDRFIAGAKTINELNGLCLEFEEGNVLATLYKNWGKVDVYPGKIDAIFKAIFDYFDTVDYADYVTTIMVINFNFFTLRAALVYLQDLLRRSYDDVVLKQKLIDAVATLKTYGCDPDKLYSESLLLYDLDLAHFVASCGQMDPRIYEPHIHNLKNLTEVERRFEINMFGKKPKSAIGYLLRNAKTSSNEIASFIQTHNVSREAYDSCQKTSRHFETVSRAFAQDLSRRGCHYEAGVVLQRGGLLEEALDEFKLSLRWREVIDVLEELKVGEVERLGVVNDVARRLCHSNVKEAAILYEYYANNYEMAVKVLLEGCLFEEAIHVAKKHKRGDIIVSDVIPSLIKHKSYLEEKLTDLNDIYDKHKLRLGQVRRNRLEKYTNVGDDADDRDDLFSDVGSTITKSSRSSRSRSSTASSRNRRKEEKKKQNLREGGIYEDIALVRALHGTVKEIFSKSIEVTTCCTLLLRESDVGYGEVKKFYRLYERIEENVRLGLREIWPPHFVANHQTQDVQELADLENFEHLDGEFRTPPIGPTNWKLNLF